jgi:hypothetical protein
MEYALPSDNSAISSVTVKGAVVHQLPGLAIAGIASIGAGAIHAGAVGIHAEHPTLARLFIASAVFQLGWGVIVLFKPSRWLAAIGVLGNLVCVGAWLTTRLTGVSFIDGLEVSEPAQFTDTACALLGLIAIGLALSALLIGWRDAPAPRLAFPSVIVAAIAIPAMIAGANHTHSHDEATAHTHGTEAAAAINGSAVVDESQPHDHAADGASVPIDGSQPHDHSGASTPSGGSQPPGHDSAVVAPVPYDPNKPIDLGGVPGVTPEQQARAENLVAITLVRLPQWSDPATAEAAGFHSIGDAVTGFEHYVNWNWINDEDFLDPDHPESLVYQPQPDGSKKLVSAMYMLPDTVSLDQVPDIGGALTQWHIHNNLCFTTDPVAPRVAGITDANGGCPATLQKFPPAPMIHVWIVAHPCGPFAALEGVGAGQILPDQQRLCDHAHGSSTGLLG